MGTVLLLGGPEAIAAALAWHRRVWQLELFARGLRRRQAHASGGRVLLVRPGRRSASDFTIRSISRRISALNGPTSNQ